MGTNVSREHTASIFRAKMRQVVKMVEAKLVWNRHSQLETHTGGGATQTGQSEHSTMTPEGEQGTVGHQPLINACLQLLFQHTQLPVLCTVSRFPTVVNCPLSIPALWIDEYLASQMIRFWVRYIDTGRK
jgi:hypothetical protein